VRAGIEYLVCKGKDYCATAEEMVDFYKNSILEVMIGDKWFNPNNYEKPIQTYY